MNWHIKKIEDLSNKELYNILKLRSEVFVVEQTCPFLDPDGKDFKALHIFLEEEGEVLAYARLFQKGIVYNEASIGRVVVNPDYRTYGYGKLLMERAIKYIFEEMNETEIKIQAQSYLYNFYSSFGFIPISEEYPEDDIPHIDMLLKKEA